MDYEQANERFSNMKQQYEKLQHDYNKDKSFYEEALEARMNQLDQLESENENMGRRLDEARRNEMDLQGRCEQLEFELDMAKRNAGQNSYSKDVLNKKEQEMMNEINDLQEQLREKDFEVERAQSEHNRARGQLERA